MKFRNIMKKSIVSIWKASFVIVTHHNDLHHSFLKDIYLRSYKRQTKNSKRTLLLNALSDGDLFHKELRNCMRNNNDVS